MNTSEKEYIYYWYHHMAISFEDRDIINDAAANHDWETFSYYLNRYKDKCTFPDTISVHDDEDNYEDEDDYIENGISEIPLNEENFQLIDWAECECG